jgi:hypothetical protein
MTWRLDIHQQKETKYYQLTEPRGRDALDNSQMVGLEQPIAIAIRNRGTAGASFEDIVKEVKLQRPAVERTEIERIGAEMKAKKYIVQI